MKPVAKPLASTLPRSFKKSYPEAVRGEGCYIVTADGRRILDAAGSAAVVSIGHGVAEIGGAMAEQASRIAFAHTSQFHTRVADELAKRLLALAPPNFRGGRAYFTSGGSEATESAMKLARQYWLERGQPQRVRIVSRRQSYHGATLGAMSVSGNVKRRAPYAPWLAEWGHIAPCYPYRRPAGASEADYARACAGELDAFISSAEPHSVAAFIAEPIVGATLGAAVPPPEYWPRVAEICRAHDVLLIADEIMTGMGRTGKPFAVQHWNVEPDMILVGKGVASGYAPLGGVLIAPGVAEAIERGSGAFEHGFTYQAHPVAMAAGLAVLDYAQKHGLFERVAPAGVELLNALAPLAKASAVGEIRGRGLLLGVEFVRDAATREPFPAEARVAERIRAAAYDVGVATYPIQGCVDGTRGDHVLLAPPFIISSAEIAQLAAALATAAASIQ